ncbi:hypothetical protein [Flavobacteriaceae bacterium 14752]|uniref:hypothetical protein n=1 Tax=Mesohalobacter salilacus TaxID=2491711 RepID=UPI000F636526|nr:hypothetical protein EIG84_11405 [Flavobacteriaceae bacterium 14752]
MKAYLFFLCSFISLSAFSQEYLLLDENPSDKTLVKKFIQQSVDGEFLKPNPVVIIDNKVINGSENLNQLDFFKSDIMELSFKPKNQSELIKKYGSQAINGVIEISTRPFYAKPVNKVKSYAADNILFMVDGKVVSEDEFQDLKPDDIKSINVVKDHILISKYTTEDYDGIIQITLKK